MNEIIRDILTFIRRFWSIIWGWITATIQKHKFKNAIMLAIAFGFWFLLKGGFWAHLGWATFYIWIGMNVESILSVYQELKKKNNW